MWEDGKMNRTQKEEWKGRTLLFFTSQCVTLFGSTLVQMAVVWYATLETSSGLWVSAFSICSYLPQFLLSLPGGLWADRCSRKRLIIGADLAIASVTLLMICLLPEIEGGTPLLASLLLMSALRSAGAGIQTPAVNAEIPRLVPEEEWLRFNGINAAMQSVVQFAAPAAAGVLLTVSDLRMVLWIDVLTAVIGTGILSGVRLPEQKNAKRRTEEKEFRDAGFTGAGRGLGKAGKLLLIYGLFVFLCVPAGFSGRAFGKPCVRGYLWLSYGCGADRFSGNDCGRTFDEQMERLSKERAYAGCWTFRFRTHGSAYGYDGMFSHVSGMYGCVWRGADPCSDCARNSFAGTYKGV